MAALLTRMALSALVVAGLAGASASAAAAAPSQAIAPVAPVSPVSPVAPVAEAPTVMRRTALIVANMAASLQFYRDALGLIVMDDRTRRVPDAARTDAEATSVTRLILFRSKDDHVGQLELIDIVKQAHSSTAAPTGEPPHLGHFAILFTTRDIMATFAKVKAVPGVKVAEAPRLKTYPSYGGPGMTTDWFCSVYDPDGNFVEINHPTVEDLQAGK